MPHLTDQLKRRLHGDGYIAAEKLDRCPKEQLRNLGYSDHAVLHIREALRQQRQFAVDISDILTAVGLILLFHNNSCK